MELRLRPDTNITQSLNRPDVQRKSKQKLPSRDRADEDWRFGAAGLIGQIDDPPGPSPLGRHLEPLEHFNLTNLLTFS